MTRRLGWMMTVAVILAMMMMRGGAGWGQEAPVQEAPGPQPAIIAAEPPEPQVKDDLFEGTEKFAQGASDVTEVNLDKDTMGMASLATMGGMARKMDFIVVHTFSFDKPGMYKAADVEEYRKKLADKRWVCFVHTRSKDDSTDICKRAGAHNETAEMVILTAEPKELTFIHLRGRMSMDDLVKMSPQGGKEMKLQPRKK